MVQPEKQPVLEDCSHYLIIRSKPEKIDKWHEFCCDHVHLSPIGVLHSTWKTFEEVNQSQPYLEITCGAWLIDWSRAVTDELISFRIDEKALQSRRWEKFEFDVAFVRNYQLFAFSCATVSDRSTCKNKLFEVHTRTKQLGGAEARVGLVCCHNFPDSLRSELEVERRDQRVAVFGRNDLGDLGQKILNWVKQNQ